jgi:Ca2+-binding EF-hand superfamily protein
MYSNDPKEVSRVSQNLSLRLSPERKYSPKSFECPVFCCCPCRCCCCCCCCNPCCCLNFDYNSIDSPDKLNNYGKSSLGGRSTNFQTGDQPQRQNNYNAYEQNQFNDLLKKLMEVEYQIEDAKTNLAQNPNFNCEDAFRLFESNDKDYLTENDIKNGLNSIGVYPSDQDVRLLMKRFDLPKNGNISYAAFFDIIVPFEKEFRTKVENRMPRSCCPCRAQDIFDDRTLNELGNLFKLIIDSEKDINNMRRTFGSLRSNLKDIFGLVDNQGKGYFTDEELLDYLQNNGLLENNKAADLLFIRLDKNRNGKIDYPEVEEELQPVY